ncbi:MAG: hypothetical protein ACOX6D_10590 [Thermoguttaceae bacterium]|jgi:hypothetical protein
MYFPYPHEAALAQIPVPYPYEDEVLWVYPLRMKDCLQLDMYIRSMYIKEYGTKVALIPEGDRETFKKEFGETVAALTHTRGVGQSVLWSSPSAMTYLVFLLLRGAMTEAAIGDLFFSIGLNQGALLAIHEMHRSVYIDPPSPPKLDVPERKPKYSYTSLERVAQIYHSLGEKYHWTYEQVLNLTDYQVYWYMYLFPGEREHIEELYSVSRSDTNDSSPVGSGVIRFNSPEDYERWKATRKG